MVEIREDILLGTRLATLLQDPRLLGDISKSTNDFLVAFVKAQDGVRDIHILAKLLDKLLRLAEVVARNAGKQMARHLYLILYYRNEIR